MAPNWSQFHLDQYFIWFWFRRLGFPGERFSREPFNNDYGELAQMTPTVLQSTRGLYESYQTGS